VCNLNEAMMNLTPLIRAAAILALAVAWPSSAMAQSKPYAFNVLNQRTIALTAEYWNPIITYVSQKSGVPLELKLAKNAHEGNLIAEKGGYDFLYTNHFFTPERDALGFQVIARPVGPGVQAQIVVPSDSPIRTLQDLEGKDVGFVSPDGFTGYWVTYDALLRAKVNVNVSFTGTQEASVAQLKVGKIAAAGVNGLILERYARREGFAYRALWTSQLFPDLCIMAHKQRVPADKIAAVRTAFVGMDKDPEGRRILAAAAALIKASNALGFVAAEDKEYDGYRTFFKTTLVKRK
jgi:phosphonate transport system substrate-binding protein